MTFPTQEQPEGTPQQSFGVPAQQPYGDPTQPAGGPGPGYPAPQYPASQYPAPQYGDPNQPPVAAGNGPATAGLILGILAVLGGATAIFGIIFSAIGLVRAPKVGGAGKSKAVIGLVLSVVLLIGFGAIYAVAISSGVKQAVTCNQTENSFKALDVKMEADAADTSAEVADFNQAIALLNSSAAKVSDKKSASDMRKLSGDLKEFVDDENSGTAPSPDLVTRITTDGDAVDADCS